MSIEDNEHDIEGGALQNRQLAKRTSALRQEEEQANWKEVAGDRISEEWMAVAQANWKNKNIIYNGTSAYKHIRKFEVVPQFRCRSNPFPPKKLVWRVCLGSVLEETPKMNVPWPVSLICLLA